MERPQGTDFVTFGSSWLLVGTGTAGQVFIAINNPSTSLSKVIVVGLVGRIYETALALGRQFATNKSTALATGGTAISQVKRYTSQGAATVPVIVLAGNAADAGGATAITAGASPVRVHGSVSPNGAQMTGVPVYGATCSWDCLDPRQPPPELEPGESLTVVGDVAASGYVAVNFCVIQTRPV